MDVSALFFTPRTTRNEYSRDGGIVPELNEDGGPLSVTWAAL
jgi:hypothetical protein